MKYRVLTVVLIMCLILSMAGLVFAAQLPDVSGHWAATEIDKWVSEGLAKGYPDGTFKPNNEVSRAEFVALLNRAFEKQNPTATATFKDVNPSDWFYAEVAAAKTAGYISGYEDGTFKPNSPISRQEAASIVARLLGLDAGESQVGFNDAATIPAWAKGAVSAVVANSIMGGYPDGSFKPGNYITRAEAVVTLNRATTVAVVTPVIFEGVKGKVLLNGSAVEGVNVRLFEKDGFEVVKETTTNQNGLYEIKIAAGTYDITAAKDKYVAYVSDVSVANNTAKDLTLAEGTVVSGKMTDANGNPLKDSMFFFTTNPTFVAKTDAAGNYKATLASDKTYVVRGYKDNIPARGLQIIAENVQVGQAGTQSLAQFKAPFTLPSVGGGGGGGGGGTPITSTITVDMVASTNIMDIVTLTGTVTGAVVTVEAYTGHGTNPVKTATVINSRFNMQPFFTTAGTITLVGKNNAGVKVAETVVNKASLSPSIPSQGTVTVDMAASTNIMDIITLTGAATGAVSTVEAYTVNSPSPIKTASVINGLFVMEPFFTTANTITIKGKDVTGQVLDTVVINKSALSKQVPVVITVVTAEKRWVLARINGSVTGNNVASIELIANGVFVDSSLVVGGNFSFTDVFVGDAVTVTLRAKSVDGTVLASKDIALSS